MTTLDSVFVPDGHAVHTIHGCGCPPSPAVTDEGRRQSGPPPAEVLFDCGECSVRNWMVCPDGVNRFCGSIKQRFVRHRWRYMSRTRLVPVLFTVLVLGVPAAPAGAAAGEGTHCVVEVVERAADGELLTGPADCYPTFAEAMAAGSDGSLRLPAATPGSVVLIDETIAESVSSFTLGIHYDGASGSGSSISVVGSSCTGGYWNTPSSWANGSRRHGTAAPGSDIGTDHPRRGPIRTRPGSEPPTI